MDVFLNPFFSPCNSIEKMSDSAGSAAFCIDGSAYSVKMHFASYSTILNIVFLNSGVVD